MRFPLRAPLALAVLALVLAAPPSHANCGGEGCPFVRDGVAAPAGRVLISLRYQDATQDDLWNGSASALRNGLIADLFANGGAGSELELYTRTRSWVAEARARLAPRIELVATLPYLERTHRHMLVHGPTFDPAFVDEWKYDGLGDGMLLGQVKALESSAGTALELTGGVKLPTGKRHVAGEARLNLGEPSTLEPGGRPGTGSTDWIAGAQYTQPLPWTHAVALVGSLQGRWNGQGTDDYRVGDELLAGLSGGYRPLPWLTLLGQANFSARGSDQSAEAGEVAHSGVRMLYLTPGASVRVTPGLSLYGLFQVRTWGETDEPNVIGRTHVLFGTTYTLGS